MTAPQTYKHLIIVQRHKLLIIKFNRPEKKNALKRESYRELIRALVDAAQNDAITTVALTGVGDCFTAGNDISQTQDHSNVNQFFKGGNFVLRYLVEAFMCCPKILVAVVNGPCFGIGFTISALCDVVYCTENALFQAPFTKLGLCPEACSSHLFPLIFGRSKAAEMLLLGTTLNAQQAMQLGFVADVIRLEELQSKLWPKLMQYAELPSCSLRATKKLLHPREERDNLRIILQKECNELEKLRRGEDYAKAIKGFLSRNKSKL